MHRAIIGAGSNLGSREGFLIAAQMRLASEVRVLARSRLFETEPVGPPQPAFLNAAFAVETELAPEALLARLLSIEAELGRVRAERWGPRTLDLDLLHVEGARRSTRVLELPHPRLSERAFALAPLLDVAPWLEAEYRPALEALGGPPPCRPWSRPRLADEPEDALALALDAWLGGEVALAVQPVQAEDPIEWAERLTSIEGACGAVIGRWDASGVVGAALRDGSAARRPALIELRGTQVVVIVAGTKLRCLAPKGFRYPHAGVVRNGRYAQGQARSDLAQGPLQERDPRRVHRTVQR